NPPILLAISVTKMLDHNRGRPLLWLSFFFTIPYQEAGYKGEYHALPKQQCRGIVKHDSFLLYSASGYSMRTACQSEKS
ncbi:MAG: hypothetical protein ACLUD8_01515, partial [Clostridium sp.]